MRRPGEELFAGAKLLRLNGVWHVRERPVVMLDEDEEGISGFKWENNVSDIFFKDHSYCSVGNAWFRDRRPLSWCRQKMRLVGLLTRVRGRNGRFCLYFRRGARKRSMLD